MNSIKETNKASKKTSRRQGTVTNRYKGSYEIRYQSLPDEDGKRKRISESIRGTRRQAEQTLRERLRDLDNK